MIPLRPSIRRPSPTIHVPSGRGREGHGAATRWASVQRQQLGAMVAPRTDEHLSMAFGYRDVSVMTTEYGGSVNAHGGASKAKTGRVV